MSIARLKSQSSRNKNRVLDVHKLLNLGRIARSKENYRRSKKIFSQGEPANRVMYIQEGGVRLSVVNKVGNEVIIALLGPGDFPGEGCSATR